MILLISAGVRGNSTAFSWTRCDPVPALLKQATGVIRKPLRLKTRIGGRQAEPVTPRFDTTPKRAHGGLVPRLNVPVAMIAVS